MNVIYAVIEENPAWNEWASVDYDDTIAGISEHVDVEPSTHLVMLKLGGLAGDEGTLVSLPCAHYGNITDAEVIAETLRGFFDKLAALVVSTGSGG